MEEFTFENYIKTNIKILRLLGLWPKENYFSEKWYLIYALILNGFFCCIFNINMTGDIIITSKSLEDVISNGQFILALMSGVKSIFLVKYNKTFKHMLQMEIHKTVNVCLNAGQNQILHKHMRFWRKILVAFICVGIINWVGSMLWPVFDKHRYALPFRCWYPYDYNTPIMHALTYFHQGVAALAEPFINLNGASFTCAFLAYITAHCEVLCDVLQNLKKESEEILDCTIKYHQAIVQYSRKVEAYFSKYLLVQFSSCCLATAFLMTSLSLRQNIDVGFIYVITLQLATWADLYIYCYYGTEVIVRSSQIPQAAYNSNWVYASKKYKKDLIFFMHRTQTPITIYAVDFFVLSIQTFTNILRTAWSYFMLLRQLSDDV